MFNKTSDGVTTPTVLNRRPKADAPAPRPQKASRLPGDSDAPARPRQASPGGQARE